MQPNMQYHSVCYNLAEPCKTTCKKVPCLGQGQQSGRVNHPPCVLMSWSFSVTRCWHVSAHHRVRPQPLSVTGSAGPPAREPSGSSGLMASSQQGAATMGLPWFSAVAAPPLPAVAVGAHAVAGGVARESSWPPAVYRSWHMETRTHNACHNQKAVK